MIIIGDAGGTSTYWRVIDADQKIDQFQTRGLNLMHHDPLDFLASISSSLEPYYHSAKVFFYVAGYFLGSQRGNDLMRAFQNHFLTQDIEINNDLIAAARSLCGHQRGWVGILGTGANVAYYNGKSIKEQVPPLGYLLGDEGSGADLGKNFIIHFFRGELHQDIKDDLLLRYSVTSQELLSCIYEQEDPKRFLSSFSSFIAEHKNNPSVYQMIYDTFSTHFEVFLRHKLDNLPVHYTGSVAYHFSDILRQVGVDKGISVGQITQNPIAGLALFHQNSL